MDNKGRLEQLLAHFTNGNVSQFARLLGVRQSTVSTWKSRNTMDYSTIKTALPQVDGNWLLTGMGDMLLPEDGTQSVNVRGDHNTTHVNSHNHTKPDEIEEKATSPLANEALALQTENKYLKTLLEEKERFIKVLLELNRPQNRKDERYVYKQTDQNFTLLIAHQANISSDEAGRCH